MNNPHYEWFEAYFDGELSDDQAQQFTDWLKRDAKHVRLLIRESFLNAQMKQSLGAGVETHRLATALEIEESRELLLETMEQQRAAAEQRLSQQQLHEQQELAEQTQRHQRMAQLFGYSESIKPIKRIVIPKAMFYGVIAAVVALAAMLFWPNQSPPQQVVVEDQSTVPQFVQVAKLVEQIDAKWLAPGNSDPAPGDVLLNQPMHLTSGLAKIRFNNEAEVILEAPCSIEPISGGEIKITHGKLVGRCRTAASKGFVVQTPGARIVDLGTEFGVSVDRQGAAETHVFEGAIELAGNGLRSPVKLHRNEARRVDAGDLSISPVEANQYAFIRGMKPQDRDPNRAYVGAVKQSQPLAYWRFEEGADHFRNHGELSLMDLSTRDIGVAPDGALFAGSKALRFDGQRSRATMPYHPQLDLTTHFTIEVWVRLLDIQPAINRILTSRRTLSQSGPGVIRETGFGLGTIDRINKNGQGVSRDLLFTHFGVVDYYIESNFNLNQWVHLVVVVDEVGRPRFYVNGSLILSDSVVKYDRNFSSKSINDMNQVMATRPPANKFLLGVNPDAEMGEERFRGDLDELAIYARSLSEQEIKQHYRAGVESAVRYR